MRPESLFAAFRTITVLPGIGPRLAKLIEKLAGARVVDLYWHLPAGLIDRGYRPKVAAAEPGRVANIALTVDNHLPPQSRRQPRGTGDPELSGLGKGHRPRLQIARRSRLRFREIGSRLAIAMMRLFSSASKAIWRSTQLVRPTWDWSVVTQLD